MAAVVSATRSASGWVGTGIALVAQRDPIVMAKEVASLDLVSGGRLDLGIGFGWNVEEMADHGVDYKRRRAVVREKVLAMKALWTEEEAGFEGEFGPLRASWSGPSRCSDPPLLIGGRRRAQAVRGHRRLRRRLDPHRRCGHARALPELQGHGGRRP